MTPTGSFAPSRLSWARRRRGLDQHELAVSLATSVRSIKAYEAGAFAPRPDRLRGIARALRFPERFFLGDEIGDLSSKATFRSGSKLPAGVRDAALGSAAVAIAFNGAIEALYALPNPSIPALASDQRPERAAELVRRKWDLSDRPIESMVQLLESKGVRVFSLPADAIEADTFSLWHRDRPFVFLNTTKLVDALRFDLAHELGHLVLHRDASAMSPNAQQAATAFASAFLMPAGAMRKDATSSIGTDEVVTLCAKWGAAPAALVKRLHGLGLLSEWQSRKLREGIPERPSRKEGAANQHREISLLLRRVFASLRDRGVTRRKMASALHIYPDDVDALTFDLALIGFDKPVALQTNFDPLAPNLRVVSSKQ